MKRDLSWLVLALFASTIIGGFINFSASRQPDQAETANLSNMSVVNVAGDNTVYIPPNMTVKIENSIFPAQPFPRVVVFSTGSDGQRYVKQDMYNAPFPANATVATPYAGKVE